VTSVSGVGPAAARGAIRLLNTTGGRALVLAGEIDARTVDAFVGRYGHEPARIDTVDARSVTALSVEAVSLLLDAVESAERAGRPVSLRLDATVQRSLQDARAGALR
jgi:ABC-type transporter Mla MlaB component